MAKWRKIGVRGWLVGLGMLTAVGWFSGLYDGYFNPDPANTPTELVLDNPTRALLAAPYPRLLPAPVDSMQVVEHSGFTLAYNEHHEQAAWVAYLLTAERLAKPVTGRADHFYFDKKVKTFTAEHHDYTHSGYDRGHLAPAADMKWSKRAMQESFLFSNISPQEGNFNGGIWREIEQHLREQARKHGSLLVVTGPVLAPGLPRIGKEHFVSVPNAFYKVAVDHTGDSIEAVGYLVPAKQQRAEPRDFIVPVDSIEAVTGLDFFPELPEPVESRLESHVYRRHWR